MSEKCVVTMIGSEDVHRLDMSVSAFADAWDDALEQGKLIKVPRGGDPTGGRINPTAVSHVFPPTEYKASF